MPEFTTGEWVIQHSTGKHSTTVVIFAIPEDETALPVKVARVLNDDKKIPLAQKEANARLIAAAPDMYGLLYDAMQDLKHYETKLSYKNTNTLWELIQEQLDIIDGRKK